MRKVYLFVLTFCVVAIGVQAQDTSQVAPPGWYPTFNDENTQVANRAFATAFQFDVEALDAAELVIDGDNAEEIWNLPSMVWHPLEAAPIVAVNTELETQAALDSLVISAEWGAFHYDNELYVMVKVTDNVMNGGLDGNSGDQDDQVEIAARPTVAGPVDARPLPFPIPYCPAWNANCDGILNGAFEYDILWPGNATPEDEGDRIFTVNITPEDCEADPNCELPETSRFKRGAGAENGLMSDAAAGTEYAYAATEDGYIFEMKFPFAEMGEVKQVGDSISFDVWVTDDDNTDPNGPEDDLARDAKIFWAIGNDAFAYATYWGILELGSLIETPAITSVERGEKISIYPNPAQDVIRAAGAASVELIDMMGRVRATGTNEIRVSGIESGTYFVRATSKAGKVMTEKVVVE